MIQSKISTTLYDFIKTTRDSFADFKSFDDKEVLHRQELYTRTKGEIQRYDKGIKSMSWSSEYFTKDDTLWLDFKKYFNRLNKKFPSLEECLTEMKNEFHLTDAQAELNLFSLLHFLLFKNKTKLSEGRIIEIVTVFVNDLNKSAPLWKIKLWIDGIWLNEKAVSVSKELLIRQPENLDFELTQPAYSLLSSFDSPTMDFCASIIEISKKFDNQNKIEEYINKIVQALRLYNLGAIQIKRGEYTPNSILTRFGMPFSLDTHSHFNYEITQKESEGLKQFIDYLMDFLPERNWQRKNHNLNPIFIGIDRYCEAITKPLTIENKIMTTITALEALLLKGNERSELSHKLSQRVSYLSRYFKDPPIKVYNTMKRAYEIRSTYIHGSMLSPEERKDLTKVQNQVLTALRRTLLIFIGLSKNIDKDDIISKIDNAIIDNNAHTKFSPDITNLLLLKLTAHNTGLLQAGGVMRKETS